MKWVTKRIKVRVNLKIYNLFKEDGEVIIMDWTYRQNIINVEEAGPDLFKVTYDPKDPFLVEGNRVQVLRGGSLFMYVPDYFLELFEDLVVRI